MSSVQRRYLTNPRPPRLAAHNWASLTLVELADMMLGVELKAELGDEVDLGFKEIDVMFLVVHQLLEEFACHIVLHTVAVGCRLLVEHPRFHFRPVNRDQAPASPFDRYEGIRGSA